ncbi:uncharacterized protein PODANS_1_23970 [Podospora anserina S mat+]|uniref:Podospora anserina S mat+ genomic DNA chromosome 1, supercontig 6 n=1 Tax=Podospora anserina (strain S / ATCC MYA-4624 / DSM 980 / FGSC 10383) TaxID=515849 RepID=B2ASM3_PODAN|nr:uncharacterized protein PODANS_1_23970 [Podospora anserina S mat+]CAP67396.1 unnamed protein product [Podospora anserina S mat+]CDP24810.1 Putative protein similar to protein YSC84 of Saccharomyces cerevisiae [Podospora anserina S mat+]
MQRVSSFFPSWERPRQASISSTRTTASTAVTDAPASTPGALGKVFGWAGKIAVPAHRLSTSSAASKTPTRFDRETYWPTTLDKECDKAARILKSFCFDGFQFPEAQPIRTVSPPTDPPSQSAQIYTTKKIPPRIIQNAVGIAIFSCMRSGLWMSGSGGAGLITARKADGTWSPPSGIILHTAELGFVIGVDIYDCVLVINSVQTLELFTRPRLMLGDDVSLAVGPLTAMEGPEPEIKWKEIGDTVLTYVKARGKHQAVALDGSLVTERTNENERFYSANVSVLDILAGNIPKTIPEMRPLFEVIKAAEGRTDFDKPLFEWLAQQPAPGDAVIEIPRMPPTTPSTLSFGIPDANDPDPFGVIGLEMAGIEIREAGSKLRPTSTQFEYHPSPTSPVFARFSRQSMETFVSRSNRGSCMSSRTQATAVTDAYTQTDVTSQAETSFSRANSDDGKDAMSDKLPTVVEPEEVDYTKVDTSFIERLRKRSSEVPPAQIAEFKEMEVIQEVKEEKLVEQARETQVVAEKETQTISRDANAPATSTGSLPEADDERDEDADDEDDEEDEEEPIICEVATAAAQPTRSSIRTSQVTQVIQAKGANVVTIAKRVPPPLPARSPARVSRGSKTEYGDVSSLRSPVRNSFLSISSRAEDVDTAGDVSIDEAISTSGQEQNSIKVDSRPNSPRHQKNSSSVSTAIAVQTNLEQRKSHESDQVPPVPQNIELPSSAEEESEREPRTPLTENEFLSATEHPQEETKAANGAKALRIISPSGSTEGSSVALS